MNTSKPKAAPKGVHDTVANLIHRNKYLGTYFKGSAVPDSRSLSSKRKQEIVDFLPSFIEHIRPVKQSRHFEPLVWKASTASKRSAPVPTASAKISSPPSLLKDEEDSSHPAPPTQKMSENDAPVEVNETMETKDTVHDQTPMDDDRTSASIKEKEAGKDETSKKSNGEQAADDLVEGQQGAETTIELDTSNADENYFPGSDAIVHKNTMEQYQADLVKVKRELEELEQRRQCMLQKQVNVWGVYQYGLHKISKLSNLADAPDAILPGNFCSSIPKKASAAVTTTTSETNATDSAAVPPSKSGNAK